MEDKELKKRLKKIPDVDKNGEPIYKIDDAVKDSDRKDNSKSEKSNDKNKIQN